MYQAPHHSACRSSRVATWTKIGTIGMLVLLLLLSNRSRVVGAGSLGQTGTEPASGDLFPEGLVSDGDLIIQHDARIPPDADLVLASRDASAKRLLNAAAGAAPGYYQTSDYLVGQVAVGLILPESDGSREAQSEDWREEEIREVRTQVQKALDWWTSLEPAAHLSFSVTMPSPVTIGYEPIVHGLGQEGLWIAETMSALGFESASYFSAVRDYVNALRQQTGADWAFAIFVVDSSADVDGRFADNFFAYAYVGGPFMVMTYDNSGYGIHNMQAVAAHEIGHIFHALDQYAGAGMHCEKQSGYLHVENGNSLAGGDCGSNVASIMRGGLAPYQDGALDAYARGQIGWWDGDGDGVLDPVDAPPRLVIQRQEPEVAAMEGDTVRFNGQAWQDPVPSTALADTAISPISAVRALLDGQTWLEASPLDGAFDTITESYQLQVGPLAPGVHRLEIQAINSEGLASTSAVTTSFVYDPIDGALNSAILEGPEVAARDTPLHFAGVATAAGQQEESAGPTVSAVQFSLDGGPWQDGLAADGHFDQSWEHFDVLLGGLAAGPHTLEVRTVDTEGRVETNVELHRFQIRDFTIFLPLLRR